MHHVLQEYFTIGLMLLLQAKLLLKQMCHGRLKKNLAPFSFKHIIYFFIFFTMKQRNTPARNNFMNISTCTFDFYRHKLSTRQPITDIFLNLSFFVLNAFFGWFVVVVPISWAVVHGSGPCIFGVLQSSSPWTVSRVVMCWLIRPVYRPGVRGFIYPLSCCTVHYAV